MSLEISSGVPSFSSSSCYVQPIAQSYTCSEEKLKFEPFLEDENDLPKAPSYCGSWAIVSKCENGHYGAKSIDCRKEWCSCRERVHKLRVARWLEKAKKIGVMGYLEISFHPNDRPRSRGAWRKIRGGIIRGLKLRGLERGLAGWHWFGDRPGVWHAHLNFLFEAKGSGFLLPGELISIKKMICKVTGLARVYANYRYSAEKNMKLHWVKYVTRPTFLKKSWDEGMAFELEGQREWDDEKGEFKRRPQFKNFISWGKWDDEDYLPQKMNFIKLRELMASGIIEADDRLPLPEKYEKLGYVERAERGFCPECGEKMKAVSVAQVDDLAGLGFERIWTNLWQMRPPPEKVVEYGFFRKVDQIHRNRGP
ncbi:hypothetical protein ES703_54040 [subsurface metagenome]